MKKYAILILLFRSIFCYCQDDKEIDSLKKIFFLNQKDTNAVKTLNEICWIYSYSVPDSSIKYGNKAISLAKEINFLSGLAEAYKNVGNAYKNAADYIEAENHYHNAITIYEKIKQVNGIARCFNNIGLLHLYQGNYSNALEFLQKALKIGESIPDDKIISMCLNNLGMVNFEMKNYSIAIDHYNKSLQIKERQKDKKGVINCLNNIANCYADNKNLKKALNYYETALKYSKELKDLQSITMCLINIGSIFYEDSIYAKAMDFFIEASDYLNKLGDKKRISHNLTYIGRIHLVQNNYIQAKENFDKAYAIAKEINSKVDIREALLFLSNYYNKINDYKNAYHYFVQFKLYNDSIFSDLNNKQLHEIQTKYQTENQRQKIANQEIKISKQETEIKLQTTIKYAFVLGFTLMIALSFFIYKNYRNKKIANEILKLKNAEISQQKEEILAQAENLELANIEITEQKNQLAKSHSQITASINYALRIQKAVLPKSEILNQLLPEHFVLFKPRDIVSGDYYFVKKIRQFLLIAAVDCTGHGVPGAFMSMLGIAFLNEIVRNSEITTSSQVLNELREHLKDSLQQIGAKGEQQDGMDIAFCAINLENYQMSFAGAHNPCWIIRKESQPDGSNYAFQTIEADHMPVGIYIKEKSFSEHQFQLKPNDTLYLFSDGFYSQFGGEKNEKYKAKRLKDFLLSLCHKNMKEQKDLLENEFLLWKGNNEQTDDILIMGIKL